MINIIPKICVINNNYFKSVFFKLTVSVGEFSQTKSGVYNECPFNRLG